jgi:hypothetical protein
VGPFEFIILFLSFIYTLALTHLLFAATRMIRHRRSLVFSWPHALWMVDALLLLLANWIALWDFHRFETMSLGLIATGFVTVGAQYFICALVSPDFEDGESYDMRAFHAREGRTYIAASAVLVLLSLGVNAAAGLAAGVKNWADQNALVLVMAPAAIVPLFVRARWVQVLAPIAIGLSTIAFMALYYPALTRG